MLRVTDPRSDTDFVHSPALVIPTLVIRLYLCQTLAIIRAMTAPNQQVRRATVEDLQKLAALWKQENLPAQDLEKRFKEFQVVEGEGGGILAAVGLQIVGPEGRLHSEAFAHPEQA